MRHEAAVQLTEHRLRQFVPTDVNLTDGDCERLVKERASYTDVEDFKWLEEDYDWPTHWTFERRLLAMYCSVSEFQLVQYLKCLSGGTQSHVFDRKMHSIFCMHLRSWR